MQAKILKPRVLIFFRKTIFLLPAMWAMLLFGGFAEVNAQTPKGGIASRYINSLINDTADISRPQFLVYPALSYSPETSWEFGLSGLYVYFARRDTTNRLSEIKAYTFYTLEKQYGLLINNNLYANQNKWALLGRLRYQKFPLLYFGIGPGTNADYLARVNAVQLQVKERLLRRLGRSVFAGIGADFQQLRSVTFITENRPTITQLPTGALGSRTVGFGPSLIFDNRKNVLNVRRGAYSELSVLRYHKAFGSQHSFTNLIADQRFFIPVNKRDVLAMQVLGNVNIGQAPFHQLALMGGENLMRGYYLGRFRDNNLVAAQAEYRFLPLPLGFTKRWGAAVFGGYGSVFDEPETLKARHFVWSAGGGLRFLVFPKKDIFTRLDAAFTADGPGFYIFIGEAF